MAIAEHIQAERQPHVRRRDALKQRLAETRAISTRLAEPLSDEDQTPQSMADASPTKWHLAHTTWFFEELVLKPHASGYREYDPRFAYCFNSYYETLGERHPRPRRGLLTRPSCAEVRAYRAHVDAALAAMFDTDELSADALDLVELGINHEQQHQELLLTDILSLFAVNPLRPAYRAETDTAKGETPPLEWLSFDGGIVPVGHDGDGFAYDNEGPRHDQLIRPFKLAHRPVTNGEWLEFMADGGYETATLWLSDGWATVNAEGWRAPCYWEKRDGEWHQMGLGGLVPVDPARPVCHISYYEAQAFALWAGRRLPSEFEWEIASRDLPETGNTLGADLLRPAATRAPDGTLQQMFGDLWEWTSSAYSAYPGFSTAPGAVGEYNGKFMCGQYVLRGGSIATPDGHVRRSYRNFFYPHQRWQFMGLRLACDA
ncbi:MAG: ergothioneine biosynthesis protein EgtB [Dichotomicrobium sp.]